jgi:hypothetical protein
VTSSTRACAGLCLTSSAHGPGRPTGFQHAVRVPRDSGPRRLTPNVSPMCWMRTQPCQLVSGRDTLRQHWHRADSRNRAGDSRDEPSAGLAARFRSDTRTGHQTRWRACAAGTEESGSGGAGPATSDAELAWVS